MSFMVVWFGPIQCYSHVLYGCLVWSNTDQIMKLRKRWFQTITYLKFNEYTGPLFSKLKLLKVKEIFH